ncbi:MAG: HAD family hydrolase [Actinobacteria bacterium]|nr:HAD family hydrolase [Actinomycetota bacterium]MBI3687425.1 HAD family hydrolase [Actinomycetota bacterium]
MSTLPSGPLQDWVVSVDLWGTLITYGDRDAEARWRLREFGAVLADFGYHLSAEQIREAVLGVRAETQRRQRATGEQQPVREQVQDMVAAMGIADDRLIDVLLIPHTHAVLRACPDVIPGAHAALWALKQADARLVLTSNTLATPGSVSRLVLDDHELTDIFDDTVFSSDIGVAKPRPEIFHAVAHRSGTTPDLVVHVGNSRFTDIRGALDAGCRAVWFNPRGKPSLTGVREFACLDQMPAAVLATCAALTHRRETHA